MGASILPIAIYKNKVYFLFGKENKYNDTPGWSDFGGGTEKGESFKKTAEREGMEELTGFLGMEKDIKKLMKAHGTFNIDFGDKRTYRIHMVPMKFDPSLPKLYNNNHAFLERKLSPNLIKTSKIFEKEEIRWISEDELPKMRNKFRSFYRVAVDDMLAKKAAIRTFARKALKKPRKTRRKKSTAKKALKRKTRRMRGGAEVAFDSEAAQQRIRREVGVKMMRLFNITNDGRRLNDSGRSREQKAIINRIISELPDDLLNTAFEEVRLRGLFSHCSNDDEIVKLERDLMDIALIYVQIKNIGGHNPNTSFFLSPIHDRISFFSRAGRLRIEESERRRRDMTMREAEDELRRRLQPMNLPEVAEANDRQPANSQQSILRRREQNQAPRNLSLAVPDDILNQGTTNY